ncbi:MAG: hypothetical protein R6U29_04675 [Desulfosudaceae bacterium]
MKTYLFQFFGEKLALRLNSPIMARNLAAAFMVPFREAPSQASEGGRLIEMSVSLEDEENIATSFPRYLLLFFTRLAVLLSDRFLFFHAASFVTDNGVLALCGSSGAGKTTLAMTAHYLGYAVSGEDFTAVDWRAGTVYPLSLPYRPRPKTREIFNHRGGGMPYRPSTCPAGRSLYRLFLTDEEAPMTRGLTRAVLGAPQMDRRQLVDKTLAAVKHCAVAPSPPVRIMSLPSHELADIFRLWIQAPHPTFPPEIFANKLLTT